MVYIGPGDFSIEMGHPGDYDHPDVAGPMEEILALCREHHVPFGTTASDASAGQRWIGKGARFFEMVDELALILDGGSRMVRDYRQTTT